MQVNKETSRMREQCVPGTLSDFSSAWEWGYHQPVTSLWAEVLQGAPSDFLSAWEQG